MLELFQRIDKIVNRIEEFLLASSILVLAAVTVGNVLSRKLFNFSWSWTEEVLQFILVLVTFMGVSYAARRSRHIRMTALFEAVSERTQKIFMIIISLLTAIILFYLAYYAMQYVIKLQELGRVTPALRAPFWLAVVWAPLGLFLGGVQYLLTFIQNLTHEGVWSSFTMPFSEEHAQQVVEDDFVFNYEHEKVEREEMEYEKKLAESKDN